MKNSLWRQAMTLLCVLAGLAMWLLRWQLLLRTVDDKGLLVAGHPLSWAVWAVTAAVLLAVFVLAYRHWETPGRIRSSALSAAVRALAMGVALLVCWQLEFFGKAAAVAALVTALMALLSLKTKKLPQAALDIPMLLFFLLLLLSRYRAWSAEPELQRYAFSLLALVSLMLGVYYRSAKLLDLEKGRGFLAAGSLGVFFSLGAMADPGTGLLFLALAAWMFTELGTVTEA